MFFFRLFVFQNHDKNILKKDFHKQQILDANLRALPKKDFNENIHRDAETRKKLC